MKVKFIKEFEFESMSGTQTIKVGDERNLKKTSDGSAVIVMGHGVQQKVPEEYFELAGGKVEESNKMKLTKARLKEMVGAELDAVTANQKLAYEGVGADAWEALTSAFKGSERDEEDYEESPEEKERRLRAADLKAAKEILATRAGDYSSTRLPEGKRVKNKMKLSRARLRQIIKEEIENTLNEADRNAGMSSWYQIAKLNPDFKFIKRPADASTRLKILQDIADGDTASIFDASGEMIGQGLDISSDKWKDIVKHGPGLVDQAMKQYK